MLYHETLYQELLLQLELCNNGDASPTEKVQQCFALAYQALYQLDCQEKRMEWTGDQEVIYHKEIRPNFLTEVFYYELVYFATLFVPEEKKDALEFWKRECLRLQKFQRQYAEFYNYYASGRMDRDEVYYKSVASKAYCQEKFCEYGDGHLRGDILIGHLQALERYCSYVRMMVVQLIMD